MEIDFPGNLLSRYSQTGTRETIQLFTTKMNFNNITDKYCKAASLDNWIRRIIGIIIETAD